MSEGRILSQPRVGARTHVGKVRSENQDRMGRFASRLGDLYIVVDGMGGHKGGAAAAGMAIDGLESNLENVPDGVSPGIAIQEAAQRTNAAIYQKANDGDAETSGMGATLVLGLLRDGQLITAHAGDSRAYLFRGGKLKRLTHDHSLVQNMIDHSMLTEEQARDHPDASVITRAFGQKPDIEVEIGPPLPLREGDGILLCTDGLCGYLTDQAIEDTINRHEDAQQVADNLIELALSVGGEDNVTIQFLQFGARKKAQIEVPIVRTPPPAGPPKAERSKAPRIFLMLAGVLALGLIAFVLMRFFPVLTHPFIRNQNRNRPVKTEAGNHNGLASDVADRANQNSVTQPAEQLSAIPSSGASPSTVDSHSGSAEDPTGGPSQATGSDKPAESPGQQRDITLLIINKRTPDVLADWLSHNPRIKPELTTRDFGGLLPYKCVLYRAEGGEPVKQAAMELAAKLGCQAKELGEKLENPLTHERLKDLFTKDITVRP